jgi:single-stranded DNA-binding protein
MNETTIVGNVTADPILRMSGSGRGVIALTWPSAASASTGTPTSTTISRRSSTASSPSDPSPRTPLKLLGKD